MKEGASAVVSVSSETKDLTNEGKLVHFTGIARTPSVLTDVDFGVGGSALKLRRIVEMYQWEENSKSDTREKLGGGTETTTTYTYDQDWFDRVIDSSNFKELEKKRTPAQLGGIVEKKLNILLKYLYRNYLLIGGPKKPDGYLFHNKKDTYLLDSKQHKDICIGEIDKIARYLFSFCNSIFFISHKFSILQYNLSMFGTTILEERESKYNGRLKVINTLGYGTYIQSDGLTQSGGVVESIWKSTLRRIKDKDITKILVLGLGAGTLAKLLRRKYPNSKIAGVEIDPLMIELGKKYFKLEDFKININVKDNQIALKSGNASLSLNIKDAQEFPPFPERIENLMEIKTDDLLFMLEKVSFLIPQNNANPALNGLLIEIDKQGKIRLSRKEALGKAVTS